MVTDIMKSKMPIVQGMVSLSFYSREQAKKKTATERISTIKEETLSYLYSLFESLAETGVPIKTVSQSACCFQLCLIKLRVNTRGCIGKAH